MKRLTLLVALLGVFFSPLTRADEPSMCKSMCAFEKQHCGKRAGTLTELDDFKGEEKNPLADTAKRMHSVPEQAIGQFAPPEYGIQTLLLLDLSAC